MTPQLAAEVSEFRKPRSLRVFAQQTFRRCRHTDCNIAQACKQLKRLNWWEREHKRPADMTLAERKSALRAAFVKGGVA